jgi:Rrf2 family protein
MKLSRTIAHAVHTAMLLARAGPGVPVSAKVLAQTGQMPERFLIQILGSLVARGILRSTRGADGGYSLSRSADQISIRDIVEAFDNGSGVTIATLDGIAIEARVLLLHTWHEANRAASDVFQKLTVADLVKCDPSEARAAAVKLPPESRRRTGTLQTGHSRKH